MYRCLVATSNSNTSSLTTEQDSLYLSDIINNCLSISAELLSNAQNNTGNSNAPIDGTSVDPNYNNYMDMLIEFLCEPVGDAVVQGDDVGNDETANAANA